MAATSFASTAGSSEDGCLLIGLSFRISCFAHRDLGEELHAVLASVVEKLLHFREWKPQTCIAVPQGRGATQVLSKIGDAPIDFQCAFVIQPMESRFPSCVAENHLANVSAAAQNELAIIL